MAWAQCHKLKLLQGRYHAVIHVEFTSLWRKNVVSTRIFFGIIEVYYMNKLEKDLTHACKEMYSLYDTRHLTKQLGQTCYLNLKSPSRVKSGQKDVIISQHQWTPVSGPRCSECLLLILAVLLSKAGASSPLSPITSCYFHLGSPHLAHLTKSCLS